MEKKQNVPALRFQGFSGEWESHYLGMLGVTFSGLSGKTKADFGHGQARFVPYLNVFNHPIADLQETEAIEIDDKQNEVKYGDIFFTTSSETPEEVGMSSVWLGNEKNVYLNSFCFGYRPTSTLYPFFMAFLLRSSSVRKEFVFLAQGISRYNISKNKAMGIGISFPLFREQCKIGDFFQNLDKFIDGKSHKIQKLQQFQQAMLAKLFPREGAAEPELRFRGFSGAWKKRKVKDILIERNEQAPKSEEYPLKAFIANEGIVDKGKRYDRSALVTDTEAKLYKKTQYGDFIYSSNNLETGSIGLNKYGNASISPVYSIFYPTELGVSDFIGYRLVRKDFIREMVKWRQGVIYGQWRIPESDFLNIDILVPSIEEQRKIGSFFRELDDFISLQQKKLERMQRLKAALLEKLFV